jgi:hypothetical protein
MWELFPLREEKQLNPKAENPNWTTARKKHGLTMFRPSCYSSLVPRVNPSLL